MPGRVLLTSSIEVKMKFYELCRPFLDRSFDHLTSATNRADFLLISSFPSIEPQLGVKPIRRFVTKRHRIHSNTFIELQKPIVIPS